MSSTLPGLPAVTSVGTADLLLIDQSATSKKATAAQLATTILASPALTGTPTAPTAAVDTSTTQVSTTAFVLAQAASATPLIDGTAAVGTSTRFARADHVHPTDTTRAALASPTFTGTPAAPTATTATNTTQLATTAFVQANITALSLGTASTHPAGDFLATANNLSDVVAATARTNLGLVIGTNVLAPNGSGASLTGITESQVTNLVSDLAAKAPLASPALTGTPTAPTAAGGTNTTQVATTAFVLANVGGGAVSSVFTRTGAIVATTGDYAVAQVTGAAPLASPTFTGTPTAPTATVGTNTTQVATTEFVLANAGGTAPPNPTYYSLYGGL